MRSEAAARGPLSDLLVLEFGSIMAGPYCTQLLADMGAEVIKIEPLGGGRARQSGINLVVNRSKRSLAVDIRTDEGREIVLSLVRQADALVENLRPGAMERVGFGHQELHAVNPRLVYCSLSGYGDSGPLRDSPGQDLLVQAVSGLMSIVGYPDRTPVPAGGFVGDVIGAMLAALGIMIALHERRQSGEGQRVSTSLLAGLLALQAWEYTEFLSNSKVPERVGSGHYLVSPVYGAYRAEDGDVVLLGDLGQVAEALGCSELLEERFVNADVPTLQAVREEVKAHLQNSIGHRTREEVLGVLAKAGVWCMPVLTHSEASAHPQLWDNGLLDFYDTKDGPQIVTTAPPIQLSRTPGRIHGPPPFVGQDSHDILQTRLSLNDEAIQRLRDHGVIV